MGEFVDRVRKSKIRHPTQQGFSLELWERVFSELHGPDELDSRLYEAGIWVFERLEKIRQKLKTASLDYLSPKALTKFFIGEMNRLCKIVSRLELPIERLGYFNSAHAIQSRYARNLAGPPLHPDDLLEKSIDGAQLPLKRSLLHEGTLTHNIPPSDEEVFNRISLSIVLGQYYSMVEELWGEVLWNGWFIQSRKNVYVVRPPDENIAIIQAVSDYRRRALASEIIQHTVRMWQHNLPEFLKKSISERIQVKIYGKGKQQKYKPYNAEYDSKVPPAGFIYRLAAQETYFNSLLDLELPNLKRLTINNLLTAWEVLRSLSEELLYRLPEMDTIDIKKLSRHSPILHKNRVATLLSTSLNIGFEDAQHILDFFTFDPKSHLELWIRPLVMLDHERFVLALGPLLYGNLLRNIEFWIKQGGLNLSERGPLFEQDARDEFTRAITSSDTLKNAGVHSNSIRIPYNGIEEEIDIVLWIKNRFLLGEAKCMLFPTEPIEFHRYFETLKSAAAQIKRKTVAALNNKRTFLEKLNLEEKMSEDEIVFSPFILTNQALGVGFPIDGIPVVDTVILHRYLNEGLWESMVLFDKNGEKLTGHTEFFYKDDEEAANNIDKYLNEPPQLTFYKRNVQTKDYQLALLDDHDLLGAIIGFEVELPIQALDFEYREKSLDEKTKRT